MNAQRERHPIAGLEPAIDLPRLARAQEEVARVFVHDSVLRYIQRLAAETRHHSHAAYGASPRGALGLMRAAQAPAAIRGEGFVMPDHVKRLAPRVLAHRIVIKPRSRVQAWTGCASWRTCCSASRCRWTTSRRRWPTSGR